ncbi:hypothetical protein ACFX2I_013371 [Malus domestica]
MPVPETLANSHTLALSSAILTHLLRCLVETTLDKVDPHQNGPLWSLNSGCKSTSPFFGQQLLISRPRKRSALSWLLDQHPLTKLRRCSYTFSLSTIFLTMSY